MNGWKIQTTAFALMSLACTACGSLLSESERIRRLYEFKNGATPAVVATDPADNSIAPQNQASIDITFSTEIDAATFTPQANFGACTGSVQISYDGFTNCIGGRVDASQNPRLRFTPTIFPKALGLQIRVTSAVLSSVGVPASPYNSTVGFKLSTPCGAAHCFFSYSTPLMQPGGSGNGIFRIRSGSNAGKYIVYSANLATTTLIDPATATSSAGPVTGTCGTLGTTLVDFHAAGTAFSGQQLLIHNGSSNVCFYDPATHSFSAPGTTFPAIGSGAHVFYSQANSDVFIVRGGGSNEVRRFDSTAGTLTTFYTLGSPASDGAHTVRVMAGPNQNKFMIFAGNNSTWVRYMDETGAISPAQDTAANVNLGAASIEVSGATTVANNGKIVTALGGGGSATSVYDFLAGGVATTGAITLNNAITSGAVFLRQSGTSTFAKPVILSSANPLGSVQSNLFDSEAMSFSAGPTVSGRIFPGSASVFVSGGANGGGFFIVHGNGVVSTSVYLPSTGQFHGSRMPSVLPNIGAHHFTVRGGINDGRTLIVGGNSTTHTAIFDPIRFEMIPGPPTQSTGSTMAFNVATTRGTPTGRVLSFVGNGVGTYDVYDPEQNTFTTGGLAFTAMGQGAVAFPISNDPRIVVMHGGGATTNQVYNQDTNTLGAAITPAPACGPNSARLTLRFTRPSTGEIRQLIYCSANQIMIFDHATASFAGAALTLTGGGGGGNGAQAFVIPSGPNVGKILFIHGGGTNSVTLIDPETAGGALALSLGQPNPACASVDSGSQLLPLTTGPNAGKILLLVGNGSKTTCMIDPADLSFTSSVAVSNTPSPGFNITDGSLAFRTNGGLFPTSYVVVSGANKNVWSVYVP